MTAAYRPTDCLCAYPDRALPTGSGHSKDCPAHQRWQANGNAWRPVNDNPLAHTVEAQRIMDDLPDDARLPANAREFVAGLRERFEMYGEQTYVSSAQMNWLRNLEEKYR